MPVEKSSIKDIMKNEFANGKFTEEEKNQIDEMSKEIREAANFNLEPHLIGLLIGNDGEPFFAYWSRKITKVPTLKVPTAGIALSGGELVMYWNPLFFSKLSGEQIREVLKHEFYHAIFAHIADRRRAPPKVWNIATDAAINSLIKHDNLPAGCVIPGKPITDLEGKEIESPLSKFIKSAPPEKSSEWYYSAIMNNEELIEYIQNDGSGEGQFDDHEGWGDASEEEKTMLREKLRSILHEAVKEADSSNKWGSIDAATRELLREMVSNKVDWKTLLKQFCGFARSSRKQSSIKKIHKKYPYIHPGPKRARQARVRVYLDESGSMSNDDIALLFGEFRTLAKQTDFEVYFFDHSVDEENFIKWKRNMKYPTIRHRSGGTNFDAVIEHANKACRGYSQVDAVIIATDGYCSQPPTCLKKMAWIITPSGELQFEPRQNEILIQMKEEAEDKK